MNEPGEGAPAPDFTLPGDNGSKIALASHRGSPVILYFYPKAMTPGCTVQACGLRDSADELAAHDTVVLGVSPDPVNRLQKFIDKESLNFTLLSDEDHGVADQYGAWGRKKFMGREYDGILRQTYIIDKQGKLCHIMDKVKTRTHHDDVLGWIKEHL